MISQQEAQTKAKKIKLLILDVDGVLTDGCLFYGATGEAYKAFHVHDGLGIKLLQQNGVKVAIITSRSSDIVKQRMQDLGVAHVYQGQKEKLPAFKDLIQQLKLTADQVAYAGDDLPDLPVLKKVGLSIAVANAHPLVSQEAMLLTKTTGGKGAVREICEFILQAQGKLDSVYQHYLNN